MKGKTIRRYKAVNNIKGIKRENTHLAIKILETLREVRSRTGKERRKKSPEIVSPQRRDQSETMTLRGSGRGRQDAPSGLKKGFDFGTVDLEF